MYSFSKRMQLRFALREGVIVLIALVIGTPSLWAYPEKGTTAPSLDRLELLQAPSGARADWTSLKGKIVLLEFWATWCSPCVASLPHLNHLVETLDPEKFQFINIDDEDTKAVQNFLAKKKMSGWVGLDSSGAVFRQFGVEVRPTTIIIDGDGRFVAATEIDSLEAADLQALAAGKTVKFKQAMKVVNASGPSPTVSGTPLVSLSITKAAVDARMSRVNHPPSGTDLLGEDADSLLTDVFDVFNDRYVVKGPLPGEHYDLRVNLVDAPQADLLMQQTVLAALHLQVEPKTLTKPAYILRATADSKKLLSPSASTHTVKRGSWHGKFLLMNGTMDDLCYALATGLESPVINETGIEGSYDARFEVASGGVDALNRVLRNTLGLELVPSDREMSISVLEISKR